MTYLLGYHKSQQPKQDLFLGQNNVFLDSPDARRLMRFDTFKRLDQSFNGWIKNNRFDNNYKVANFFAYNESTKLPEPLPDAAIDAIFDKVKTKHPKIVNADSPKSSTTKATSTSNAASQPQSQSSSSTATPANRTAVNSIPKTFSNIDQLIKYLTNPKHRCLVLDLEFFHNINSPKPQTGSPNTDRSGQRIQQIAGKIFNEFPAFNYHVFEANNMKAGDQLDFLKQVNITYQQADTYNLHNVLSRVKEFIQNYHIDTIISYNNGMDFYALNHSGYPDIFKDLYSIDIAKFIKVTNINSQNVEVQNTLALHNLIELLNIPNNPALWHHADHDVDVIDKLLQTYAFGGCDFI